MTINLFFTSGDFILKIVYIKATAIDFNSVKGKEKYFIETRKIENILNDGRQC